MGAAVDWDGEEVEPQPPAESESQPAAPTEARTPDPGVSASPACRGNGSDGDEESIENYMERLLGRIRGEHGNERSTPVKCEPAPQETPPVEEQEPPQMPAAPPSEETLDETEYVPRSAAPERSSNLAAMRELANESAHSAINTCFRRRRRSFVFGKVLLALFAVAVAATVVTIGDIRQNATLYGALVASIMAGAWVLQVLLAGRSETLKQHRLQAPRKVAQAEPPAEAEPTMEAESSLGAAPPTEADVEAENEPAAS
jgi:hypothetical protein